MPAPGRAPYTQPWAAGISHQRARLSPRSVWGFQGQTPGPLWCLPGQGHPRHRTGIAARGPPHTNLVGTKAPVYRQGSYIKAQEAELF